MEARKPSVAESVAGTGFFNRSTEASAFTKAINEAHQAPYTSVDAEGRKVQITDNDYWETFDKAWEGQRPELLDAGQRGNHMWTAPYADRSHMMAAVHASGMYTMDEYEQARAQAEKFGVESLRSGEQEALQEGTEKFSDALKFMEQTGAIKDGKPCYGVRDELRDTGRYVKLATLDGSEQSGYLMELEPMASTHRFLDLECPEGTAQILSLEEGTYNVASEWQSSPLIQAGIEAARKAQAEYGHLPTHDCGAEPAPEAVKTACPALDAMMREKDRVDSRESGPQVESDGHGIV